MIPQRRSVVSRSTGIGLSLCAAAGVMLAAGSPAIAEHKRQGCREAASVPKPFVSLVAHEKAFDTGCLVVPADRDFRIYFKNQDRDMAHNVSIYPGNPDEHTPRFKGNSFHGPRQEEYVVEGLSEGKYWFKCDTHWGEMGGELKVEKKKYDTY